MDEKDKEILAEYNRIYSLYEQGEDIDVDVLDFLVLHEDLYKEKGLENFAIETFDKAWAYILKDEDTECILMDLLSSFIAQYVNAIGGIDSVVQ